MSVESALRVTKLIVPIWKDAMADCKMSNGANDKSDSDCRRLLKYAVKFQRILGQEQAIG